MGRQNLNAGLIGILCALASCATGEAVKPGGTYDVDIRWTSYGIPHVKADDWGSLGYGFAYVTATDAVCVLARQIAEVRGERSMYWGSADGNFASDVYHRAIITDDKIAAFDRALTPRQRMFNRGYVAGYNRYIAEHADALPASCRGQAWVRPISEADVSRMTIGVGIAYGIGRFKAQMTAATPPDQHVAGLPALPADLGIPEGIGSNAVAVGRALSHNGRGLLLGNPHYPWEGHNRFHMKHLTIPGELDVMGVSLIATTRVSIGFNRDIAWTHTVSTALRMTLYELALNPENPMQYAYGSAYRDIGRSVVTVPVRSDSGAITEVRHTIYTTHYGPIVQSEELPWSEQVAYTLRDAVIDNYQTGATYDALAVARSTAEVEAAISQQGVFWTNTIAADKEGNAYYADISNTPNVDNQLLADCRVQPEGVDARLITLHATPECEWREDETSIISGNMPPDKMPRITRDDYVTNSNDSYWLSTPHAPLEGYSPIIGPERTARSLRTRAGLTLMEALAARAQKITPDDIKQTLYSHRNFGAELLLDDLLSLCGAQQPVSEACSALRNWDRTMNVDSRGSQVWTEFWRQARSIPDLYAVPFDPAQPVTTPRGINSANDEVRTSVLAALADAETRLVEKGVPLNAPLADIQFKTVGNGQIPIPGGQGWAGMFSMIVANLNDEGAYTPIVHGNSYVQVVGWDAEGNVQADGILTYSQSPEPDADHFADQTRLYAQKRWLTFPFTEDEIVGDTQRSLRLTE